MRRGKVLHESERVIEFVPPSMTRRLCFDQLFGRNAPLQIDLGCGDGAFLTALAAQNPQQDFLGIERLLGRVRSVCRKTAMLQLSNVRVLRMDATYAVAHLLSPGTISAFHLLFPDPWPKRRHHRRRALTPEFLAAIHRALVSSGLLHIATDHADYFNEIKRSTEKLFDVSDGALAFPPSTFQKQFAAAGVPIHRLVLRKTSPVK
jgi:tRNA (guanine-N7-)-methyltransferase